MHRDEEIVLLFTALTTFLVTMTKFINFLLITMKENKTSAEITPV